MIIETENKPSVDQLFEALKMAHDECWKAKIASYDVARKHSVVCVQIARELSEIFSVSPDIAELLKKRFEATDGRSVYSEDFWASEDLIISFFEELQRKFDLND